VIVEGKRSVSTFNAHQLIATAMVTSFTGFNLHPELNLLILVIMMSTPAQICFYDYKEELLEIFDRLKPGKTLARHTCYISMDDNTSQV